MLTRKKSYATFTQFIYIHSGSVFYFFTMRPRKVADGGGDGVIVLAISVCPSVNQLYKFEKCIAVHLMWLFCLIFFSFYMNKRNKDKRITVHDIYTMLIVTRIITPKTYHTVLH
jgi:hypothetical protein